MVDRTTGELRRALKPFAQFFEKSWHSSSRANDGLVIARIVNNDQVPVAELAVEDVRTAYEVYHKTYEWIPTHRHLKTGNVYRVLARGKLEWSLAAAVVYQARDGAIWVRPASEFDDGRFQAI